MYETTAVMSVHFRRTLLSLLIVEHIIARMSSQYFFFLSWFVTSTSTTISFLHSFTGRFVLIQQWALLADSFLCPPRIPKNPNLIWFTSISVNLFFEFLVISTPPLHSIAIRICDKITYALEMMSERVCGWEADLTKYKQISRCENITCANEADACETLLCISYMDGRWEIYEPRGHVRPFSQAINDEYNTCINYFTFIWMIEFGGFLGLNYFRFRFASKFLYF